MKLQRPVKSQQTATSPLAASEDGGDPSFPAGIKGYSAQNPEKWMCQQAAGIDWYCCSTWRREHSQGQGSECIYMTSLSREGLRGRWPRMTSVLHQTVEWASKCPTRSFKHPIRKKSMMWCDWCLYSKCQICFFFKLTQDFYLCIEAVESLFYTSFSDILMQEKLQKLPRKKLNVFLTNYFLLEWRSL